MIDQLFAQLERVHPLSDAMKIALEERVQFKQFARKTLLLREGQVANYACFVISGLSRAYYLTGTKDITSRFIPENFLITSWISFYTRQPGYEWIETLEDCTVACFHYDDLLALYDTVPELNIVGRKLTEFYFYLSEKRTQLLRMNAADERYKQFLEQSPGIIQRVPLKYIASYLGMTDETLSRVRARLARSHDS